MPFVDLSRLRGWLLFGRFRRKQGQLPGTTPHLRDAHSGLSAQGLRQQLLMQPRLLLQPLTCLPLGLRTAALIFVHILVSLHSTQTQTQLRGIRKE